MKDILIVEDGKQYRERLAKLFTDKGYSVESFESVGDAEECLAKESFRLAILDIGLGDRSGSLLFSDIRARDRASFIVIFTGNPSVHLKQRFLAEGAADYIVKGSPQARNEQFLGRVQELIGEPQGDSAASGIPLEEFVRSYVAPESQALFFDSEDEVPSCLSCGARSYVVCFAHEAQMPPDIRGKVCCEACGAPMDPEITE